VKIRSRQGSAAVALHDEGMNLISETGSVSAAPGYRALVVDDEVPLADVVASYLRRDHFEVTVCHSGAEALTAAREVDPDVVVLDLGLPGIDGLEVCRQLRTFSDAYVVMLTGYIFAHYLSYLIERGQETLVRLADPLGRGWHLLGLNSGDVVYFLSMNPALLWTIKVACVVIGHVVAVIAAHDQALRVIPVGHQLTGQLTMMLVMVAYTLTGLYLLFGG
jgi:CheY-like chemotaxis protein